MYLNRRRCFFNDSPVACCLVVVACGMCGSLSAGCGAAERCGALPLYGYTYIYICVMYIYVYRYIHIMREMK